MKVLYLCRISVLTLILMIISSFAVKAQDQRQRYPDVKIPEPGSKINELYEQSFLPKNPKIKSLQTPGTFKFSVYSVINTNDIGSGSLREAINNANINPGKDLISFSIPGSGIKSIQLNSPLPLIEDSVIIDGTTQAGYTGKPMIEISGYLAGISDGLIIYEDNCLIKGIAINGFSGVGIGVIGNRTTIEGCFVGLDANGITNRGNGADGIVIFSADNIIGNPGGNRNVISGNLHSGIRISSVASTGNKIRNTSIGTDYAGLSAVPNGLSGIYLFQTSYNTIGGPGFLDRNLISGNLQAGIRIEGGLSSNIVIKGNYIGTTVNGNAALGNLHGIEAIYGAGAAAGSPSDILIGGKWTEGQNLISGNLSAGVAFFFDVNNGLRNVVSGNLIGTNAAGNQKIANTHGIFIMRSGLAGVMPGVKIGGFRVDSCNVVSGNNQFGIWIKTSGARNNLIWGNYIGTTKATPLGAISALGNGFAGVALDSTTKNYIGEADLLRGNVIGANSGDGIAVLGTIATDNFIYNNFIGTNTQQGVDLGNLSDGIYLEGSNIRIGGFNLWNEIAYNDSAGIYMSSGSMNRLNRNNIYKNNLMGIDIFPRSINPNDSGDVDLGPNLGQNFPVLDSAALKPGLTTIHGRFYSKPNTAYKIFFYKNNQKSYSHFGEGEFLLDSMSVSTNDSGWNFINVSINKTVSDTQFITALAVDNLGNTSEFSRALCLRDSDGDGIFDCWESENDGIDVNADGIIDYDLFIKGARPDHKDIFVEVDYMTGFRPNPNSLIMVHEAFKAIENRYVNNPDGTDGINLIIELDSLSIPNEALPSELWTRFFQLKKLHFGTPEERGSPSAKEKLEAKKLVYRYCIWGSTYGPEGSSGIAENKNRSGGNDFLVTLGSFNTPNGDSDQQAGTFMHELGHTLGLEHGGIDTISYKPNYYSVMNYQWQYPQGDSSLTHLSWKLVYSTAVLPPLNENNLHELKGLDPQLIDYPSPVFFPYSDNNGTVIRTGLMYPLTSVDWDGNGDSSNFATRPVDVNRLEQERLLASPGQTLLGYADWPNLVYNFRLSPNFRDPVTLADFQKLSLEDYPYEMTPAMYANIQSFPPFGIVPPVIVPSSLLWLGTLGGDYSEGWGVSDDGEIVVGTSEDSLGNSYAFRWTALSGMQSLGSLGGNSSQAKNISSDGSTIIGESDDSSGIRRAFRWTEATGMLDLGAGNFSSASSVSANGSVITINKNQRAYRWTSGSLADIGDLGGTNGSGATAISANGSVIVGYSYVAAGDPYAFRWNGTMTNIGTFYSFAQGVSGDGNVVTGFETGSAGLYRAFRWKNNIFEFNIVGNFSTGSDLSYDGKYLVGDGSGGAFRLSEGTLDFFNQKYSDLLSPGSEFYTAFAVSSNGRYVVGYGKNGLTNHDEAYFLDTGGIKTSIKDNAEPVSTFSLSQNYPNPFNPVTTIRYEVPVAEHVIIVVYNIVGQKIATLIDEYKSSGRYELTWNAAGFSSGIYFYRIQAGNSVTTKKMILMK